MLQVLGQRIDFVTNAPVHGLNLGTRLQVHDTMCEQVEHLFPDLLGIVPVFEHIAGREVIPDLIEVLHQLVRVLVGLEFLRHLGQ